MQVGFDGQSYETDMVQGSYTDGLTHNNTLHWTMNLPIASCSAQMTIETTVPQFGKEGTFALGARNGKGYAPPPPAPPQPP